AAPVAQAEYTVAAPAPTVSLPNEAAPQKLAVVASTTFPAEDANPDCATSEPGPAANVRPLPTELAMESHPPYVIETPDVLWIATIQMIPRSPYAVQALDVLMLRSTNTLPSQPIDGAYTVTPDGRLNLGFSYGSCRVAGMSVEKAEEALRAHLDRVL